MTDYSGPLWVWKPPIKGYIKRIHKGEQVIKYFYVYTGKSRQRSARCLGILGEGNIGNYRLLPNKNYWELVDKLSMFST